MCEPEDILAAVKNYFQEAQLLSGKSIVITAGPTYESIDAVRFIGNRSSGKMGMALADACTRLGASVTLISGPVSVQPKLQPQHHIKVRTAAEMHAAVTDVFDQADIVIMAAAVADYTPANKASGKIKKGQNTLVLELQPTVDILKELGARKKPNQILVGFALETDNGDAYAQKKLEQKNADAIVLNLQSDAGSGFEHDTNQVSIFLRNGEVRRFPLQPKEQVATAIVQTILELLHG
jgi:phosphopantothenoylcysteine decarboxylase/phosphopantothenate--cysteine ligase